MKMFEDAIIRYVQAEPTEDVRDVISPLLEDADAIDLNSYPARLAYSLCRVKKLFDDDSIHRLDTRLVAASLKSLLLWNTASDELDNEYETMMHDDSELDDFPVEETWESKLYKENQGNAKEREMAFKEGKKLLVELSIEELTKRYCEYITQKYPQIKDGFDNGLYRIGMADFHEHLGLKGKEYQRRMGCFAVTICDRKEHL